MGPDRITLLFVCNGLLFIILGIPLALSKIGPNGVYGFRTSKTLSDPQIWYAVNRVGGIDLMIAGFAIILGSLLFKIILKSYPPSTAISANVALLTFALVMVVAHSFIVVKRY
jgi:uncharacterized membrane protein